MSNRAPGKYRWVGVIAKALVDLGAKALEPTCGTPSVWVPTTADEGIQIRTNESYGYDVTWLAYDRTGGVAEEVELYSGTVYGLIAFVRSAHANRLATLAEQSEEQQA